MTETFEGYVTRHALTKGIERKRLLPRIVDGVVVDADSRSIDRYHGEGKDWHRTWESALKRAEEMRKAKLASLRKSMVMIETMQFVRPA